MEKSRNNSITLLGRRIRSLRNLKNLTQQELGNKADINYKFLGEIERGQKNPSFMVLAKIADALEVELSEIFRFEQEISDRKEIEKKVKQIIKSLPIDALRQVLLFLRAIHPTK